MEWNSLFINNSGLVLRNQDDGDLNIYQLSCKDLLCNSPGEVVGRTMFADSFTSPDTGKSVGVIYLGQSIDDYLYSLNDKAWRESSAMVGFKSRAGGEYDVNNITQDMRENHIMGFYLKESIFLCEMQEIYLQE